MDGDRRRGAGRVAYAVLAWALALASFESDAFAQEPPPSTFPGQRAQPRPQQPQQWQDAPRSQPAPQRTPTPAEPRLSADEHTCETLFEEGEGSDDDEALGSDEECFRDDDVRWRWQLAFFTGPTRADQWDESLAARGYGPSDVLFGGETSLLRRLGPFFGLGARSSVRDLRWLHHERPAAAVFAWDLLFAAEIRFALGRKELFALGLDFGVGVGLAFSRVNAGRATDVGWRLQGDAVLALRIVGPAAAIVRLGYDHFPVTIGDSLDARLGGFRVALGLEIRE